MSKSQEFNELHQQLEKWWSNNEVHAKPGDRELYVFFKKLLVKMEGENEAEEVPVQNIENENIASFDPASDDDPPGGNNPGAPDIP